MGRGRRSRVNWARDLVRVSVAALVAVVVLFAASLVGNGCGGSAIIEDMNSLRQIVSLAFTPNGIPLRDGAFDPYALVRRGDITGVNLRLFRSERSRSGPTVEEIDRGDYTTFPWERYRGDGSLGSPSLLLLWEKGPDKDGGRLVALSDGSARYCEAAEFAFRRLAGAVVQSGTLPMKDGAFDPYAFVRDGRIPAELLRPSTDDEIARGDYTNFPWERYRGDGKLGGTPFPLLWTTTLVGMSDGTVHHRMP